MKKLYNYQEKGIESVLHHFLNGAKRVVYQLPTGGGKTLTSASLIHSFLETNKKSECIFFVHRIELLEQFKRAFESQYKDYEVGVIDASCKIKRFDLRIFVCMIETGVNRLKNNPKWFGNNVGLMVIDEAHTSSFDKIFSYLPNVRTVGLTATPVRMAGSVPMNEFYSEIVSNVTIKDLISQKSLAPNKTYVIDQGNDFKQIKKYKGDFQASSVFEEFSKAKYITNVVKAYEMKALGTKTIVFNSNVQHSILVDNAFKSMGYPSRHLDGETDPVKRKDTLNWFKITNGAILHNVGVLNAGFDEPTIQTVIFNRPTTSLALWLQSCGRGSRSIPSKSHFNIIDMGGNAERLGDWSDEIDWKALFYNAKLREPGEGIAPKKTCPECFYLLPLQAQECLGCGHKFVKNDEIEENNDPLKLKLFINNFTEDLGIEKIITKSKLNEWKGNAGIYAIRDSFVTKMRAEKIAKDSNFFVNLQAIYENSVKEFYEQNGKEFDFETREISLKLLEIAL